MRESHSKWKLYSQSHVPLIPGLIVSFITSSSNFHRNGIVEGSAYNPWWGREYLRSLSKGQIKSESLCRSEVTSPSEIMG